jgi:hypothetical protein
MVETFIKKSLISLECRPKTCLRTDTHTRIVVGNPRKTTEQPDNPRPPNVQFGGSITSADTETGRFSDASAPRRTPNTNYKHSMLPSSTYITFRKAQVHFDLVFGDGFTTSNQRSEL